MLEQLKSIIVLLVVLFVAFGVGVLVGYKLPENESFQRWQKKSLAAVETARPTEVAVMQMPGAGFSQSRPTSALGTSAEASGECCPGGVCKLPPPVAASDPVVAPQEEKVNLTFYHELADKPTESGGSALKVKTTPAVDKKKKSTSLTSADKAASPETGELWELRVCSLAQEIKARLVRSELIKTYPGVDVEAVQVAGKGTWYRVKICNIGDRALAERYQRELSEVHNYKPLLIRQGSDN
ncbi:MAG: SPOR domain-containing protein [Deltaproteobacteria bacterium]|nr:SPOR domain-containing protein [Deltaproteobacteria bacterium]